MQEYDSTTGPFIFCSNDFVLKKKIKQELLGPVTEYVNPWSYWSEEEKKASLRLQRNYLLQQTDWITLRAVSTGIPENKDWKDYRQLLRDFPANANVNLSIEQIIWPAPPNK